MCKVTQLLCRRCGTDTTIIVELCEAAKTKKIADDPLHSTRNEFIRAVDGPRCAPCNMAVLKIVAEEEKRKAEKLERNLGRNERWKWRMQHGN